MATAGQSSAQLPAADIGLMAPKITELLPNPEGTGNDATDEYIELYNPNSVPFDLTGFVLRSGLKTFHTYPFPGGTLLPPQSFTAFYSETTNLSLSNSRGQVALLDPHGAVQSMSAAYASAKDGQAWALANGTWMFTANSTPGAPNIIIASLLAKQHGAAITQTTKIAAAPKVSKTKKTRTAAVKSPKKPRTKKPTKLASHNQPAAPSSPIHPWVLALVATAALLYGAYEYRADMANRIFQLRSYISARRANRGEA